MVILSTPWFLSIRYTWKESMGLKPAEPYRTRSSSTFRTVVGDRLQYEQVRFFPPTASVIWPTLGQTLENPNFSFGTSTIR